MAYSNASQREALEKRKLLFAPVKKSLAKELLFESSFLIVHDMPILKWYHLFL